MIEVKKQKNEKLSKELEWALSYLEKIYGSPDPTLTEVIMSKIFRISTVKGPGANIDDISFDVGEVSFEDSLVSS